MIIETLKAKIAELKRSKASSESDIEQSQARIAAIDAQLTGLESLLAVETKKAEASAPPTPQPSAVS